MTHRRTIVPILGVVFLTLFGLAAIDALLGGVRESNAHDPIIYLSAVGNDSHPGTATRPLATPGRAIERAREFRAEGITEPITVRVGPGTYFLDEPIRLTPEDSHLTIVADPVGAEVTLSGGRPIDGVVEADGTWHASISEASQGGWRFRELFVDDRRAVRARTPNAGVFRIDEAGPDRRMSFTYRHEDSKSIEVAGPSEESGAEVVFFHDWSTSRVAVNVIEPESRTIRVRNPIGAKSDHYQIDHFEAHPRYYLEGVRAFLDHPGEFHLDTDSGELSYVPRDGESVGNSQLIAPRLKQLFVFEGGSDPEDLVVDVVVEGIRFAHCLWNVPAGGYAAGQATAHEQRKSKSAHSGPRVLMPAAITCDGVESVRFIECRVEHVGGSGIHMRSNCRRSIIKNVHIEDVAGNGIMVGEMERYEKNPQAPRISRANSILDSTITRCGALYSGSVGIWVGIAQGTRVERNTLSDLPYTGISVGWSWNERPTGCRENQIVANRITRVMQVLSDGGGIYTLGYQPGSKLVDNIINNVPVNAGRAESNGIFLDEGSSGMIVEGNTIDRIARSPIRFHKAGPLVVRNNRLGTRPDVTAFRFNNTDETRITFEDNPIEEDPANQPSSPRSISVNHDAR